MLGIDARLSQELEAVVYRAHGALDVGSAYNARDADRRRRDDLDVDARLFEHQLVLLADPSSLALTEGRPDVEPHTVASRNLDRAGHHHARAARRHLEHLLVAHLRQLPGARDQPWIGGEHAFDVGED